MRKAVLLIAAVALQGAALAQDFPGRPVTLIVPTSNGTSNDLLARILAPRLSERWKQP